MKPFRERNQTMIGAVGIVRHLGDDGRCLQGGRLPIIGAGDIYYADFSEVAAA